jgi:hypothetical protein
MIGLSSTMAKLAACCRVVFSGSLYPFGVVTLFEGDGALDGVVDVVVVELI